MDCDLKTQVCDEPTNSTGDAKCLCREGYVNMGDEDRPDCQVYNPCDETHRNISIPGNPGPACIDSHAKCTAYGHRPDDYMCVCDEGFKTVKGMQYFECFGNVLKFSFCAKETDKTQTSCAFIKCAFPSLNDCKQLYNQLNNTSEYECTCADEFELEVDQLSCKPTSNVTKCGNNSEVFWAEGVGCKCRDGYSAVKVGADDWECKPNRKYIPISR